MLLCSLFLCVCVVLLSVQRVYLCVCQWRLLRVRQLIIMTGMETMEWYRTHQWCGFHEVDTTPFQPLLWAILPSADSIVVVCVCVSFPVALSLRGVRVLSRWDKPFLDLRGPSASLHMLVISVIIRHAKGQFYDCLSMPSSIRTKSQAHSFQQEGKEQHNLHILRCSQCTAPSAPLLNQRLMAKTNVHSTPAEGIGCFSKCILPCSKQVQIKVW
jgi:hypothetical protein